MYLKKAALFLSALSINFVYTANISFANSSGQEKVEALKVPANMVAVVHFQAINGKKLSKAELQERLFKAIIADKADEVKALAAMGADIEYEYTAFNSDGNYYSYFKATPLNIAIRFGRIHTIKALLGLVVTVPDDCQLWFRDKESYKILLEIVEIFPGFKKNALKAICDGISKFCDYQSNDKIVVDQIGLRDYLKKCQSVGVTINELWSIMCNSGSQDNHLLVEEFLKQGANPNLIMQDDQNYTNTPLSRAIHSIECIKVLLDYGANVHLCINRYPNISISPLQLAFQQDRADVIELLLAHGATF